MAWFVGWLMVLAGPNQPPGSRQAFIFSHNSTIYQKNPFVSRKETRNITCMPLHWASSISWGAFFEQTQEPSNGDEGWKAPRKETRTTPWKPQEKLWKGNERKSLLGKEDLRNVPRGRSNLLPKWLGTESPQTWVKSIWFWLNWSIVVMTTSIGAQPTAPPPPHPNPCLMPTTIMHFNKIIFFKGCTHHKWPPNSSWHLHNAVCIRARSVATHSLTQMPACMQPWTWT